MTFFARQKLLAVTFDAGKPGPSGQPVFISAAGSGTTLTISNLRMSAKISKTGGVSMNVLELRIYGMTLPQMNQITTARLVPQGLGSSVKFVSVAAGDDPSSLFTVFSGGAIVEAYPDFGDAPDVPFIVVSQGGLAETTKTLPGTSIRGSASVADIMRTLANQMGLAFENSGVTAKIQNPHLYGSGRDQARMCAEGSFTNFLIDDGVLAIWPFDGSRNKPVVEVSPETGMIGYPAFDPIGLSVRTLFNPQLHHGATINVKNALDESGGSSLPAAEGEWIIQRLDHDLESFLPHGQWATTITARRKGNGLV